MKIPRCLLSFLTLATLASGQTIITTVAGNGSGPGFSGDGGPATSATLGFPAGVAVDGSGNIYFTDTLFSRVRKVGTSGTITTVAGNGIPLFSGDGGLAINAGLSLSGTLPSGVAVDGSGNLYIGDTNDERVRKIDSSGHITTVAGSGKVGFSGDGGAATSAALNSPTGVAIDSAGNLYIADAGNGRVRKVSTSGTITTVAGNGAVLFAGDGGPAIAAQLNTPAGLAVDGAGNLYIADTGNARVRKVDTNGVITTFAGEGIFGTCLVNGAAPNSGVGNTQGVAVDSAGNLYISDPTGCVQKVDTSGTISLFAGYGQNNPGDGGPATSAQLGTPIGIAADKAGNVFFADYAYERIRKVSAGTSSGGTPPAIFSGGVVNGAGYSQSPASVAPGSIVSIFGSNFSTTTTPATSIPLPLTLDGVQVMMNGIASPLFVVTPSQINALVPWELENAPSSLLSVVVVVNGVSSAAAETNLGVSTPGIFSTLSSGSGPGVITHAADGSLVTAANPAVASEYIVIYCSGLGAVSNQPATGAAASSTVLSPAATGVTASIGNYPATVAFAGLSPGFVGLYQVNVQVPANAQTYGNPANVVIFGGSSQSNTVTLAVQ